MVKTFKHSGDLGDIIYSLPVIKELGGGVLYLCPGQSFTCLTHESVLFVKSLLLEQEFIVDVKTCSPDFVVDYDLDEFRNKGFDLAHTNLAEMYCKTFGLITSIINRKWLECEPKTVYGKTVVFHRSNRYHNRGEFWVNIVKSYGDRAVFVGLREEYESFVKKFACSYIPFYQVGNALELAQIIEGCELFVGNQSFPFSVCEGLKKRAVLEVSPFCPNCCFSRIDLEFGEK